MRLQPLEHDIGGDLKYYIWDEEDHQRSLILVANQIQIGCQAENSGIRDIGSVKEGEEVQHRQDGDNSKVDLGQQAALGHAIGRCQRAA